MRHHKWTEFDREIIRNYFSLPAEYSDTKHLYALFILLSYFDISIPCSSLDDDVSYCKRARSKIHENC